MLNAATRLFGTRRFHAVRMEDVAAQARVSKGTLYRYFRDKEEMYLALLARASRQLVRLLEDRVHAARGAQSKLVAFIDAVITFFDGQPHLFDLIVRAEALHGPGRAFPWQPVRETGIRMVGEILREAKRNGEFAVAEPHIAVLMLLGGMRALVRFGSRPRPPRLAERMVHSFLHGVASQTVQVSPNRHQRRDARKRRTTSVERTMRNGDA